MNNFEDKSAKQLHKAVTKEKQCECPCHGLKLNVSDNFKNSCSHCQSPKIDVLQTIIKGIWVSGFMNHPEGQQEGFEQIKFLFLSLIKKALPKAEENVIIKIYEDGSKLSHVSQSKIYRNKFIDNLKQLGLDIEGRG